MMLFFTEFIVIFSFLSFLVNDTVETDYLLKAGRSRQLSDDHVWWSIFTRPIRSRFNRKQRVSAAFAFLYLSFLVNAMW